MKTGQRETESKLTLQVKKKHKTNTEPYNDIRDKSAQKRHAALNFPFIRTVKFTAGIQIRVPHSP
jgi:hypothetical protein